jgi:hypothetical protein
MTHSKDNRPDPLKPTPVTNKPDDTRLPGAPKDGRGSVTGGQAGMADPGTRQDKVTDHAGDPKARSGIDTADTITEHAQPGSDEAIDLESDPGDDMGSTDMMDDRRDHSSEREENLKGHKVGDEPARHKTRAND